VLVLLLLSALGAAFGAADRSADRRRKKARGEGSHTRFRSARSLTNNQGDIMPLLLELAPGHVASADWKQVFELQQKGLPTPVPQGLQSKSETHMAGQTPEPEDELELPLDEPLEDELLEDEPDELLEDDELLVVPDELLEEGLPASLLAGEGFVPSGAGVGSTSSAELHA
jgi:hypothetical protein